jgi:hypothetical protein
MTAMEERLIYEIKKLKRHIAHIEYALITLQSRHGIGYLGICVNAARDGNNHPHWDEDASTLGIDWDTAGVKLPIIPPP